MNTDPIYKLLYRYATAGFLLLGLGYLIRSQVPTENQMLALLLGVFPNLLGSFATPFILLILAATGLKRPAVLKRWVYFAAASLITLAGVLVIEWLHVAFQQGAWDHYDVLASIIGGIAAGIAYGLTTGPAKPHPAAVEPAEQRSS